MPERNMIFAWFWLLAGLVSGAVHGMFFHRDEWMGGYGSWRRRITRLGHIAFIGTALINIAFALTVRGARTVAAPQPGLHLASNLLIAGAVGMPLVCYLSGWWKPVRLAFVAPVACLLAGVAITAVWVLGNWGSP